MFDDPKRQLYELEQALKEAEMEEQEDLEEAEEEDWLQEFRDLAGERPEAPVPSRANREPQPRKKPAPEYSDEGEEPVAVFVEKPKRKGAGSLVFLALLELAAIGLVAMWWIKWML